MMPVIETMTMQILWIVSKTFFDGTINEEHEASDHEDINPVTLQNNTTIAPRRLPFSDRVVFIVKKIMITRRTNNTGNKIKRKGPICKPCQESRIIVAMGTLTVPLSCRDLYSDRIRSF